MLSRQETELVSCCTVDVLRAATSNRLDLVTAKIPLESQQRQGWWGGLRRRRCFIVWIAEEVRANKSYETCQGKGMPRIISVSGRGFALPSILLLITILSLVAAGVISLVSVRHLEALREIAQVKAEYAAQSGIAKMLAGRGGGEDWTSERFTFDDSSVARVDVQPWGVFQFVRSEGTSMRAKSTRFALAGSRPSNAFQQALVFGNPSHQVVFAGTSSITGNVLVGQPGVTTGSLRNVRTPPRIPITGTIMKEPSPTIPQSQTDQVRVEISTCKALLDGSASPGLILVPGSNGTVQLESIPDSTASVRIGGNVTLGGNVARREHPLRIAVNGRATLGAGVSLRGLVCLSSSQEMYVSGGANMEHAILVSRKSIQLETGSVVLGQLISPIIEIDSGSTAKYPSAILSFPVDSMRQVQRIRVHSGARVEGLVALAGTGPSSLQENIVEIEPGAVIVGASYSENRTTLDGTVIGSVFTKDFYFYQPPTQYLGWIRSGIINRTALPPGYLVPLLFTTASQMDVMDWL